MAEHVVVKMGKINMVDEAARETGESEYVILAFGETDKFDYLSKEEVENMTPVKALEKLGEELIDEAHERGGFVYLDDFISLPFEEEKEES